MDWMKRMAIIVLAIGVAWPSWSLAQGQDEPGQSAQGGKAEVKMGCERRFSLLDKDGNGQVTAEEFGTSRQGRGRRGEHFLQRIDLDGNGVLTKEEFCAGKAARKAAGKMPPDPSQPLPAKPAAPQSGGPAQ